MIISAQSEEEKRKYEQLVNKTIPKTPVIQNAFFAFLWGGTITTTGQLITNICLNFGLDMKEAGAVTAILLVATAAILTGLGVWDSFAKVAGAGAIVPITGFANSMVASAMEYKREGMIFGLGAKLFSIAGPVIVYGIVVSWLVGLIAYLLT